MQYVFSKTVGWTAIENKTMNFNVYQQPDQALFTNRMCVVEYF